MASSDFLDILNEAEKLTASLQGASELPNVDRSLRQVLEATNDLYSRVARTGTQDIQANILLGSKGVDLPQIVQKLETISTKRSFEPAEPIADTNIEALCDSYLRSITMDIIDTEIKKARDVSYSSSWEHQRAEWSQERRKLISAMSAPSGEFVNVPKESHVYINPPLKPNLLGLQENVYATKLAEYNRNVIRGGQKPNLIEEFATVAQEFKDTKVSDMWEIMKYMTQLPPYPSGRGILHSRQSLPIVKALVHQAKSYLEDRYKTYMSNIINENMAEARHGGFPGTYSLVRSFVGIRFQGEYSGLQDGLIDERPLWPMVYYCIRTGNLAAVIYCLMKARTEFKDLLVLLETKFKSPDSPDIPKLEENLQLSYRRNTHNSTDPFKRIVWDSLCYCDTTDEHSEVAKTADDYLWLKLSYLRFNSKKDDTDVYRNLQTTILEEYGESHYNASVQPHLYFQMLALTGQFEAALEFLARTERYRAHGVHIAIALHELNLLALSANPGNPLLSIDPADPKPSRRLNIARFVLLYVSGFEATAPAEAVQYYYILRNIRDDRGRDMFAASVVNLAVDTRAYKFLFGTVQHSGIRTKAYLDEFASANVVNVESLANEVASELVDKGQLDEAIELYDLASNQEDVLKLLNTLLSQVVHLPVAEGSLRERLQVKVNEIASRYSALGYNCSTNTLSSFTILKNLLNFFDQYHRKQFTLALKLLGDTQLIPLRMNEVEERVSNFRNMDCLIGKVLPDVVLATMNVLFAQYQKVKSNEYIPNRYQETNQEQQLVYLREQAKALMNFVGMLPYRMPGDTNSRLVQMEILMH